MNRTNIEHAIFAVAMQVVIGFATGNWWAGASFGFAFFLGREHAQFEYALTNGGPVGSLNPLAGFAVWKWNKDAQLDLLFPAVSVLVIGLIATWIF